MRGNFLCRFLFLVKISLTRFQGWNPKYGGGGGGNVKGKTIL